MGCPLLAHGDANVPQPAKEPPRASAAIALAPLFQYLTEGRNSIPLPSLPNSHHTGHLVSESILRPTLWLLAATLLSGCASTPLHEIEAKPDSSIDAAPLLTLPIGVVADTQVHESRGVASRYLGLGGDEVVDVTIRTGQQVIGSEDILTAALQRASSLPLIVHAGDAIDVSCQTEWKRFKRAMSSEEKSPPGPLTWLFTPGNHDGFLTGNVFPMDGDTYHPGFWANLCNAGQMWRPDKSPVHSFMPKHLLVQDYVRWLGGSFDRDEISRGCDKTGALCWAAYAPQRKPWQSFLVQLVRLPRAADAVLDVYALLLDSSDYESRPHVNLFSLRAGVEGSLSAAQLDAARSLLSSVPPQAKYFFIAHHPASDWRGDKWSVLRLAAWSSLLQDPRSLRFLVSAHTHTGSLRQNLTALGSFVELNTGSLADAPLYLRTLEFRRSPNGRIGVRSEALPVEVDRQRCAMMLPLHREGELDYDVDTQRTEGARAGERSIGPVAIASALRYFFNLWESKHKELRPHLLAYADVVDLTMPTDATIKYTWTSTDSGSESDTLHGSASVSKALRANAGCTTGVGRCSTQAKGNLLMEVERYYTDLNTPEDVRARAHELRLCMAVSAAYDSAASRSEVRRLYHYIAKPWSVWLTSEVAN